MGRLDGKVAVITGATSGIFVVMVAASSQVFARPKMRNFAELACHVTACWLRLVAWRATSASNGTAMFDVRSWRSFLDGLLGARVACDT